MIQDIFEHDNAKPHIKAGAKLWSSRGTLAKRREMKRVDQPARSPDLNVLDLYVWRVMKKHVNRRLWTKYRKENKTVEVLWECIQHAWEHAVTPAKIECGFRLLHPAMEEIKKCGGDNTFKLPHTGIRTAMRAEGWDI